MTMSGAITPDYYYFVIFNTSNDPTGANGPEPVIAPPWGNGFVGGSATSFVEYHSSLPYDGYAVYSFISGTSLQQYTASGIPTQDTAVTSSSRTLEFTIPLSYLATGSISTSAITNIQVNMIATDRLPSNPNDTSAKLFDALGNSNYGSGELNDYVTISTTQSGTYNNTKTPIEPAGDVQSTNGSGGYSNVSEPSLDIVDWSVEVSK
jgi:hypothetical protein